MARNQCASTLIFNQVIQATKDCCHSYKQFEMKRPRVTLQVFWGHMVRSLKVEPEIEKQAVKLVWKLSSKNFKMSSALLYKLSTVCLILAQKLYEDQINTLLSYSLVSGISMKDLKSLELQILTLLDFNLNLSQNQRQSLPPILLN